MLKGHATIELTDVNTGEKQIIEEDNIVTNGLNKLMTSISGKTPLGAQKLLRSYPISSSSLTAYPNFPFKSYPTNVYKHFYGGLALFDGNIEENVNNVYAPSDVNVIGTAINTSYSGENNAFGSYNEAESGAIDGGYKHVWDFNTAQANGEIACACLTTIEGAGTAPTEKFVSDIGGTFAMFSTTLASRCDMPIFAKNPPYWVDGTLSATTAASLLFRKGYCDYTNDRVIYPADMREWLMSSYYYSSSCGYSFADSLLVKKSVTLAITKKIFNKTIGADGVMAGLKEVLKKYAGTSPGTSSYYSIVDENNYEEVIVNMPQELIDALGTVTTGKNDYANYMWFLDFQHDEGYIYIPIFLSSESNSSKFVLAKEQTIHIWKISVDDFSSEYIKVTNTTGEKAELGSSSATPSCYWDGAGNNYLYYATHYLAGETPRYLISVTNNYVLLRAGAKGYIININDNTDVKLIKVPNGNHYSFWTPGHFGGFLKRGNKVYAKYYSNYVLEINLDTGYVRYRSCFGTFGWCIYDWETSQYVNTDDNSYSKQTNYFYQVYGADFWATSRTYETSFVSSGKSDVLALMEVVQDPFLLMTINNLSEPVVKTSAQTMKVTYTLMEVDE